MTQEEFWKILLDVPEPRPIFFRLYHDDQGRLLFYSMEDLPGTYIDIDQATYSRSPTNVVVVNGQLRYVNTVVSDRLWPSESGTACHPQDVAIVVDDQGPNQKWSKQTHVYQIS